MNCHKTVFISGHLDLTEDEFIEHYVPAMQHYCAYGYSFIVGDARGADTMSQIFLANNHHCPHVLVYHMFETPRNLHGKFATVGGFLTDSERDAAMTIMSNTDLLWVRPGREKSGTSKNLQRRKKIQST